MASCNVQSIISQSNCFNCLYDLRQIQLAIVALLCRLLQTTNPMASCDVTSLLESAKCFECLSDFQLSMIQAQLLCEISSSGISGVTGVYCGVADPVADPGVACALYYRTDTGSIWLWDGAAWQQKVA